MKKAKRDYYDPPTDTETSKPKEEETVNNDEDNK